MKRAVSFLVLIALTISSVPFSILAQEVSTNTPNEIVTTEATSTPEVVPEETLPTETTEPPVEPDLNTPSLFTTAISETGYAFNQNDASHDIVFSGAGGWAYYYMQPPPVYTATASGVPTKVRMYLARDADGDSNNWFLIDLVNADQTYACHLLLTGHTGRPETGINYQKIPVGDASNVQLIEFENPAPEGGCVLTEGEQYTVYVVNRVSGSPGFVDGTIFTKGADDTSSIFLQVTTTDFPPPVEELPCADGSCTSNILFLPGFLGSRLYTQENGHERKLWEPNGSQDVRDLALNPDGTSPRIVYTRDIIDKTTTDFIPVHDEVYDGMLSYLDDLKNEGRIADWHGYPYDWRYDVFDVVDNGALKEDGSREYLENVVANLASNSLTGKVTVIGHSNGGLVAKALMKRLEEHGKVNLIDNVVLIASPQTGTPEGAAVLFHGRDMATPLGIIIPADAARTSATTFPGAYGLLPTEAYFADAGTPPVTFSSGALLTPFINGFGISIDSYTEFTGFATNIPNTRTAPTSLQIGTPLIASNTLLERGRATHAILDSWSAPSNVSVHEIAGWGNKTVVGMQYYEKTIPPQCLGCYSQTILEYKPVLSSDGDDTVMSNSALHMNSGVYFDLYKLANLQGNQDETRKHQNIAGSAQLHKYISNYLGLQATFDSSLFTEERPTSTDSDILISVHSPVLPSVTDSEGHETGIFKPASTQTDLLYTKEDVPRSDVVFGGEGKYVVLPKEGQYEINLRGTGTGTFDFLLEDDQGHTLRQFSGLPVSTTTLATLSVTNGSSTDMKLDMNGDGTVDATVKDKLTRKDAILFCRQEIGLVRTLLVRLYLLAVTSSMELAPDQKKYEAFRTEFKNYIKAQLGKNIPSDRAAGIALCITALENSKK